MEPPILPSDTQAALEQAMSLHQAGRLAQARTHYLRLLEGQPRNPELLALLGTIECQTGNLEGGLEWLGRSLAVLPDQPKVHFNQAGALLKLGRAGEALACYDRVLVASPGLAEAWCGRGAALKELNRIQDALASFDRALALRPGYAEAWNNRGNALRAAGQLEEALTNYEEALRIRTDYAEVFSNKGNVLHGLMRLDEAMDCFDRALSLRPGLPDAQWNKSLVQLLKGDFQAGWRGYEWRSRRTGAGPLKRIREPLWLGDESLAGRTLLIHPEQGLGDFLQFSRYALAAKSLAARVVLEVPRPLVEVISTLGPDFTVVAEGDPLPPYDLRCPVMSLPLAFGTTVESIPAAIPYLSADPVRAAKCRESLGPRTRPRVGLFWAGNQSHRSRLNRSIPLELLAPLLDLPLAFHSLQKELPPQEAAALRREPRLHRRPESEMDFPGTAALIEAMDLVVTVDSSIAHLAGAMGKPVWILLPYAPDFRWMLARPDSPWYPTATLFRQPARGDWPSVLKDVAEALMKHLVS